MVKIKVFTHFDCHHCMKAVELVDKMKREFRNLDVEHIDVVKNPEEAARYKALISPTIIVEDHVFHGVPKEKDLREKIRLAILKRREVM